MKKKFDDKNIHPEEMYAFAVVMECKGNQMKKIWEMIENVGGTPIYPSYAVKGTAILKINQNKL